MSDAKTTIELMKFMIGLLEMLNPFFDDYDDLTMYFDGYVF